MEIPCIKNQVCALAIDWLEIFGLANIPRPDFATKTKSIEKYISSFCEIGDRIALDYKGHGSDRFLAVFDVFLDAEKFGVLKAFPRLEKGVFKENTVQFKLENSLLYTNYFLEDLMYFIQATNFKIRSFTRLDLAVDGANHLIDFCNNYKKQSWNTKQVIRVGKATFNEHAFSDQSMKAASFTIGKPTSSKYLSIYLKSKELKLSNKNYIKLYWEKNGLDTQYVERCEIRMNSKFLSTVQNLSLEKLTDPDYLAGLAKKGMEGLLEFRQNTDSNLSRCKPIELINWRNFNCERIEVERKQYNDDIYKAKLTIHLFYKNKTIGLFDEETIEHSNYMINKLIAFYDLEDWFLSKVPEWHEDYKKLKIQQSIQKQFILC